jgi:hypothetical protein
MGLKKFKEPTQNASSLKFKKKLGTRSTFGFEKKFKRNN